MSPRNRTPKSCKFLTHRSLLITGKSPLPRSPSYSGDYSPSYLEGYPADYPEGYSGSNSASYADSYSEDYLEGYPPRYSESYPGSYRESYPEGCYRSCPENCSGDNPESNSGSNWESYSEGYPESNRADCGEHYPDSYPESFDSEQVAEPAPAQGPERAPDWQLPEHHHRVPERRGDNGTGLNGQGLARRGNRALSPTAVHRPSPPPSPRRHGPPSPCQATLNSPSAQPATW
jgi:hypothetical protein